MLRRTAAGLATALSLTLTVAACSSGKSGPEAAPTTRQASTPAPTVAAVTTSTTLADPLYTAATAAVPVVDIFDNPGDAAPSRQLESPHPMYGTPRAFFVKETKDDWLKVLLPMRPNGSEGWIRASDVTLTPPHPYRIVVELDAKRLTVHKGRELILDEPIGVGRGNAPTPGGFFYTTELLKVLPEQPEYGPFAFGLSGYSEVHLTFTNRFGDVGDGQFAIHGTNDPSSIGSDVTNGCIRMNNDAITRMAEMLPRVGIPVEIKA